MDEIVTRTISLNCGVDHAFEVFIGKIDLWWPRGHRKHRDGVLRIEAGALIDCSADGAEWTMATLSAIEPPVFLRFDWYRGSPGAPTEVEVRFSGDDRQTEIVVTHRPLLETKSIWPQRVEMFERGWNTVLPAFKSFIEEA